MFGEILLWLVIVINCEEATGEYFVHLFKQLIENLVLDMSNCIGNSTDGAANMQGPYKGFSNLLSKYSGNQLHVWCYGHVLNLVIADTTKSVLSAGNLFSLLNDIASFIRASYQKKNI